MQFKVPTAFTSVVSVYNHTNPEIVNMEQYVPEYAYVGELNVFITVDPLTGRMNMQVPTLIDVKTPYVANVRDQNGVALTIATTMYKVGFAVPILNAYGQFVQYKYNLTGLKR